MLPCGSPGYTGKLGEMELILNSEVCQQFYSRDFF